MKPPMENSTIRGGRIALAAIILIGLALRFWHLDGNLYADEVWILSTAEAPWNDFFIEILQDWVHPPLFHFVVRAWVSVFGHSDLAGRLVATVFGILSIPLGYYLGRQVTGNLRAGLLSAALVSLSPVLIYHSQYGRHYSLFVFGVLLSTFFFLKYFNEPSKRSTSIGYVLSCLLLVYTHYFGWLVIFCQWTFILIRRFNQIKAWGITISVILLAYLPWIYCIVRFRSGSGASSYLVPHIAWMKPPSLMETIRIFQWFNGSLPIPFGSKIGMVLLGGAVILAFIGAFRTESKREEIFFLFACVVMPVTLVFIISHLLQPMWVGRALLLIVPAYYLLIVIGSQRATAKISTGLMCLILLWMSAAVIIYFQKDHRMPFETITRHLENESESRTPILVENAYLMNPIFHYYRGQGVLFQLKGNHTSIIPSPQIGSVTEVFQRFKELPPKIISVTYTNEGKQIRARLVERYSLRRQAEFAGRGEEGQVRVVTITTYERL